MHRCRAGPAIYHHATSWARRRRGVPEHAAQRGRWLSHSAPQAELAQGKGEQPPVGNLQQPPLVRGTNWGEKRREAPGAQQPHLVRGANWAESRWETLGSAGAAGRKFLSESVTDSLEPLCTDAVPAQQYITTPYRGQCDEQVWRTTTRLRGGGASRLCDAHLGRSHHGEWKCLRAGSLAMQPIDGS